MAAVREFTREQQADPAAGFEPQYGHVGCAVCGMEAQALEPTGAPQGIPGADPAMTNDWAALSEWSHAHAATHSEDEHTRTADEMALRARQ